MRSRFVFNHLRLAVDEIRGNGFRHWGKFAMSFNHEGDHPAMQHVPFGRTLAVLLAFRDFCLAERVLDSHFGFSGHHFDVHPELATIILNDANISAMYAADIAWRVRFKGHVLFDHGCHSRLAGGSRDVITKAIVSFADLAPIAGRGMKTKGVELSATAWPCARASSAWRGRIQTFAADPIGIHNPEG